MPDTSLRELLAEQSRKAVRSEAERQTAALVAKMRLRYPDLAMLADQQARRDHNELLAELRRAHEALEHATHEAHAASGNSSPLIRERGAARLAEAQRAHDALVRRVEASQARLPT